MKHGRCEIGIVVSLFYHNFLPMPLPLLTMRGISKRFGATAALQGVDLSVQAGEIHALIGENGAGKSTLMKILAGVYPPDSGEMFLDDPSYRMDAPEEVRQIPYRPTTPADARRQGIAMIYQERNLAPDLSVEANIMLGLEPVAPLGFLRNTQLRKRVVEALETLGHTDITPDTPVGRLGPGQRQLVEIARALVVDARIVVLDEPTSSLSARDTARFFTTIHRLRDRGVGIIYISHFLEEILEIADRYTVLRDGRVADTARIEEADLSVLIRVMIGRPVETLFPTVPHDIGTPILQLDDLTGVRLPQSAGLTLHQGEILGLFGLVGSGRTELLRTLFGLDPIRRGRVTIATVSDGGCSPSVRMRQGMGLLSEDRQMEGLAIDQSISDNLTYGRMQPFTRWGILRQENRRSRVIGWMKKLGIRARGPEQPLATLSGGNQQKVAMARLLHWDSDIVLLDEPTRGIDIASKAAMYEQIGELAARGKAVLFVSSYLPELIGVCDRLCVMHRGRLSSPMDTDTIDAHQVMSLATVGWEGI